MRTTYNEETRICIPVMGKNKEEVLAQATEVKKLKPDIVEWRMDYLDTDEYVQVLEGVHQILEDIPLIVTFRTSDEGGEKEISFEKYFEINVNIAKVGKENNVEFVDVEAYRIGEKAKELINEIQNCGLKVIGSNHNFEKTPRTSKMIEILCEISNLGADVSKMAVMPHRSYDITRLIRASRKAREITGIPVVTMAMGEMGSITRVCTNLTGSIITFAAGVNASAPGQVSIDAVRYLMEVRKGCEIDCNIALIGFMGSGKTTISNALSKITGFKEVDVDKYIELKAGMLIKDIFAEYGEEHFRKLETEALRELQNRKGQIISCGGGAVLKDENVDILKSNSVIVRLEASPETIFERVKDSTARPLLNGNMCIERVVELMSAREPRYSSVADITINVDVNNRVISSYDLLKRLEEGSYFRLTGKK